MVHTNALSAAYVRLMILLHQGEEESRAFNSDFDSFFSAKLWIDGWIERKTRERKSRQANRETERETDGRNTCALPRSPPILSSESDYRTHTVVTAREGKKPRKGLKLWRYCTTVQAGDNTSQYILIFFRLCKKILG